MPFVIGPAWLSSTVRRRKNEFMNPSAVVELLRLLDDAQIEVWLDGGWGVDALLGVETRPHQDVDIIARVSDTEKLRDILRGKGFVIQPGGTPSNFVFADSSGREVDVHAVTFDENGNGVYRMAGGQDWIYPAAGFGGQGTVSNVPVRCLSPEAQVLCHAHGYPPTKKDIEDMERLRARFGVELPAHLRRAVGSS
ncbi:MAG: hypothetical protein DME24_18935 [Verrucomicrobia bacterium]|nr:MAG: hypothetical protein DME24_18935 [Verrucomicrobiota bacterium]